MLTDSSVSHLWFQTATSDASVFAPSLLPRLLSINLSSILFSTLSSKVRPSHFLPKASLYIWTCRKSSKFLSMVYKALNSLVPTFLSRLTFGHSSSPPPLLPIHTRARAHTHTHTHTHTYTVLPTPYSPLCALALPGIIIPTRLPCDTNWTQVLPPLWNLPNSSLRLGPCPLWSHQTAVLSPSWRLGPGAVPHSPCCSRPSKSLTQTRHSNICSRNRQCINKWYQLLDASPWTLLMSFSASCPLSFFNYL